MSNRLIRAALETAVSQLPGNLPTVFNSVGFDTPAGPYQACDMFFTPPSNPTMGDDFYRQLGYMQLKLYYPPNEGTGDISERGEIIRSAFHRGLSLEAGGVTVIVDRTPHVPEPRIDGDRLVVSIRVNFYADIFGG